ncbi:MAG: hypothetical protein Sylvanvirus3_25 [Sylvanvirus sp.]|uniref:Uncharacterized protein n=1 Tax=Sylvanvirus sp. TaxID=2487774 RepID=A0A3G5AJH1_9VIRU|nr:MAG: hypothetical protein Sylvanvirus3_25 [Sylvanvirus sp.]
MVEIKQKKDANQTNKKKQSHKIEYRVRQVTAKKFVQQQGRRG